MINKIGYCGFGDSCIYIHDRGDYKTGWELEEGNIKHEFFKNGKKNRKKDNKVLGLDQITNLKNKIKLLYPQIAQYANKI